MSVMRKLTVVALVLMLSPTGALSGELAKEGSYDLSNCWSGVSQVISHSKTHMALGYSLTGTSRSTPPGGPFDMQSFQCVAVGSLIEGKYTAKGFCEYLDADGDKSFGEIARVGANGTWKFIAGTGKYVGITGGGTYEILGQFPTIKPGTFQGCNRAVGTYKLP